MADAVLQERVKLGVEQTLIDHGYSTPEGGEDRSKLVDFLLKQAEGAVVPSRERRAEFQIDRREIVRRAFPNLVGPEDFPPVGSEEREYAEALYNAIDKIVWTMLAMSPNGAVQQRLNGDGYLLCHVAKTRSTPYAVYITRDLKCLEHDYFAPLRAKVEAAVRQMGASMSLAIDRVPEHAEVFEAQVAAAGQKAATASVDAIQPALAIARASKS